MRQEETQFNAGLSIAQEIDGYFKLSSQYKYIGDYDSAFFWLERSEIRMSPNINKDKEAPSEIIKKKQKIYDDLLLFRKRYGTNKKIPSRVLVNLKQGLDDYETYLTYCRDTFGYGMPTKKSFLTPGKW